MSYHSLASAAAPAVPTTASTPFLDMIRAESPPRRVPEGRPGPALARETRKRVLRAAAPRCRYTLKVLCFLLNRLPPASDSSRGCLMGQFAGFLCRSLPPWVSELARQIASSAASRPIRDAASSRSVAPTRRTLSRSAPQTSKMTKLGPIESVKVREFRHVS